jgi:hypothetical protein
MSQTETNPIDSIVKQADVLFDARDKFEKEVLARTNQHLYKILSGVLELYLSAKEKGYLEDTLKALKKGLEGRDMKVQKNTQPVTVFVRYIFNSDRKRAHAYSKTLLAAMDEGVKPDGLAEFVEKSGGIEEIKRNKSLSSDAIKKQQALEVAESAASNEFSTARPIMTITLSKDSVKLDDGTHYAFMIARKKVDGELEVLAPVPRTTNALESMAMKIVAKNLVEKGEANKKEEAKTEEYSHIKAAAAAMQVTA